VFLHVTLLSKQKEVDQTQKARSYIECISICLLHLITCIGFFLSVIECSCPLLNVVAGYWM